MTTRSFMSSAIGTACSLLLACGDNRMPVQPADAGPDGAPPDAAETCPAPAVTQAGECVLQGDVDLATRGTLELPSFTSLDCGGHKIFTSMPGTDIANRSTPEVGVLLREALGATLKNCIVEGFDFPIYAINSKLPSGADDDPTMLEMLANRIFGSTITGRYTAITLLATDNTRITDNTITFTTSGGQGILVLQDSDRNQIKNNTISVNPNTDTTGAVKLPGPPLIAGSQTGGTGCIYLSQGTGLPTLLTAIIDGKLYQWTSRWMTSVDESFGADNLVEGNTITSKDPMNDISASVTQRVTLRNNQLGTARIGVLFGSANYNVTQNFPGTCSGDATRSCFNGGQAHQVCSGDNTLACAVTADCGTSGTCVVNECFIRDIDQTSKGDCTGRSSRLTYWFSDSATIEGNQLIGPFASGIQVTGPSVVIRDNQIQGPTAPGTDLTMNGTGLDVRNVALQSGTFTRNRISGFVAPLRLFSNAANFGAKFSLNDFGSGTAAILVNSTTFPADISVGTCSGNTTMSCSRVAGGRDDPQTANVDESTDECASLGFGTCENRTGNHWGLPCSTNGGFDGTKVIVVGAGSRVDAQGVVTLNGSATTTIRDSYPYGVAVAGLATPPTTFADGFCTAPP